MKMKVAIIFLVILIFSGFACGVTPNGMNAGPIQFDSIIELNSINMNTHVLLFVRYIVSSDFYNVSILWAEPHIGALNYPIYPPTTKIDSNDESFNIKNDIHTQFNSVFSKPIGKRDVFTYMLNDYSFDNIRYAESEALASRIYRNDMKKLSEPNNNWQNIRLPELEDTNNISREVGLLNIKATKGRIDDLKLIDFKGYLIKSIGYEYLQEKDVPFLKRQNILLAERPFVVGFQNGGIKLTLNGSERMIKKMVSTHHAGSRKCTVDYEQIKIGDKLIVLPVKVEVYSGDGKALLRASYMMNFRQVDSEKFEENKIEHFASFDDNEKYVRDMLLKYWMDNPGKIENEDLLKMRQIQKNFEDKTTVDFAGDQLRRINMLLQLDWVLGDTERLSRHYKQYLAILTKNGLEKMLLEGGQQVIETSFRWKYYDVSDELLSLWIDTSISINNTDVIMNFARKSIDNGRFWEIACMLKKFLLSSDKLDENKLHAEVLRCSALYGLYKMLLARDEITSNRKIEQANWVLYKMSIDDLEKIMNDSIEDAQKLFMQIENPNKEIQILKQQLDELCKIVKNMDSKMIDRKD